MTRQGTRERVEKFFRARPGRSVSVLALVRLAPCRYRQSISENRSRGMNIINETQVINGVKCSWYRYEPNA